VTSEPVDLGPVDLERAAGALLSLEFAVDGVATRLAAGGRDAVDHEQALSYDLAHVASAVATGRSALRYGALGESEARLAAAYVADTVAEAVGKILGNTAGWRAKPDEIIRAAELVSAWRDPSWLEELAETTGARHLDPDLDMAAQSFRRFAEDRVAPLAEQIHRRDGDIPEDVISGLADLGAFALSIPEAYGGSAGGGAHDHLAMVVVTEELSRISLAGAGSLITRPEILTRALIAGGTEAQRQEWLPRLASGEWMTAVAVTEPDFGSDVAGITLGASRKGDGWVLSGTKTWSTFAARADVIMVLARTDPDRGLAHRGLSLFVVRKERCDGSGFVLRQPGGGRLEGRPIPTLGYRGMHSYELSFDGWEVPAGHLIGGPDGEGRGFYLQMAGFENGRLQTAGRAVGVMQAAYEEAVSYTRSRTVFGRPLIDYQLTRVKLARMTILIQALRQRMYDVARLMGGAGGSLEASMIKAQSCRAAEWVTREAMQLHGAMGYAEEVRASRLFVDARVLSIFEGADETLALKVIARRLAEGARPA
jgi:(2S)-methylsuccinyl-CoA dehydrogenase